ncbi:MAG: hypothetical protein NC393_01515 [Clostridium sp.]|nr:hypothetical protein [Clostridium sp.]MCM1208579.1 hypothetical protein [Ruminococcus sp.]MCM1287024.1 hypothetical protein [Clostridium sp.]
MKIENDTEKTNMDNENLEYLSSLRKRKGSRIIAWICLVIIAAVIIATIITGVTGSKYFAGCLFLCIIVPILMYVFLWVGKLLFNSDK